MTGNCRAVLHAPGCPYYRPDEHSLTATDRIVAAERIYLATRREGATRHEAERRLEEADLHLGAAKLDRMDRERTWERG